MCVDVPCVPFQKGQKVKSALQLAQSATIETKFSPGMKTEVFMGGLKCIWLANACNLQSKKKFQFVIVLKNINRTVLSIAHTTLRLVDHKPSHKPCLFSLALEFMRKKQVHLTLPLWKYFLSCFGVPLRQRCTAWIFIAFQSWFSIVKNFWECAETLIALSHTRQVCILNC